MFELHDVAMVHFPMLMIQLPTAAALLAMCAPWCLQHQHSRNFWTRRGFPTEPFDTGNIRQVTLCVSGPAL